MESSINVLRHDKKGFWNVDPPTIQNWIASFLPLITWKSYEPYGIFITGHSGSGKQQLIYNCLSIPYLTCRSFMKTGKIGHCSTFIWDLEQVDTQLFRILRDYISFQKGMVLVIDSSNPNISELKRCFEKLMQVVTQCETAKNPLLVLLNKQDLHSKISAAEVVQILDLPKIERKWIVRKCSGKNKQGVTEAFRHLFAAMDTPSAI